MALLGVMELIYGSGNVKPIIPVIQKPLNHLGKSNTFVVELDLYEILEDLVRNDVTEHSSTYLIDYDKGIMYSSNGMEAFMTDSEKITLLKNENNLDVKEYKFKNGRLFAKNIDFLQEDNKIIALYISDSDLYTNIFGMRVILISAIIYSIILLLVLGGLLTLKAYKPINLLMNGVSSKVELKNYSGKNNEMQYINNAFTELVSINEHLKDDLSIVMPIACEKYLLLMLKSNDSNYINLEDKLRQYGVIFPHSNFCVVDIEVKFTKKYVDKFTSNERMIQIDRIFKLIKDINFKNSVSYIVSESNHKLYYIMNTADTKLLKEIESTFECFLNAVKNNGEYIKLNIGIGTIHKHLIGIRSSFNEAQCAGRLLDDLLDQSLMVYSEKRQDNTYLYTMMDENSIYNNLNLGNYEEAISIMKTIVLKNNERNTSEAGIRQLYMSFYRIAERIIYERQKKVNDILNEVDVILESELKSMNNAEIINYVMLLYDSIVKFFFSRKSQTNINEIIEYIKDNMSNDVCLDKIASHFGLTPKYISKLFKDKLEISYSHYFNVLRIEEAKRQLVNTDSTIENIYKNMCYNSRSSFIRMFKKFEGITPSEFRSYHKVKI
jgi:AraC-like DNA-binding protein